MNLYDDVNALIRERDALRARVAELEKDKARLDVALTSKRLQIQRHTHYNNFSHEHVWVRLTTREAIDAAMKEPTLDESAQT